MLDVTVKTTGNSKQVGRCASWEFQCRNISLSCVVKLFMLHDTFWYRRNKRVYLNHKIPPHDIGDKRFPNVQQRKHINWSLGFDIISNKKTNNISWDISDDDSIRREYLQKMAWRDTRYAVYHWNSFISAIKHIWSTLFESKANKHWHSGQQ